MGAWILVFDCFRKSWGCILWNLPYLVLSIHVAFLYDGSLTSGLRYYIHFISSFSMFLLLLAERCYYYCKINNGILNCMYFIMLEIESSTSMMWNLKLPAIIHAANSFDGFLLVVPTSKLTLFCFCRENDLDIHMEASKILHRVPANATKQTTEHAAFDSECFSPVLIKDECYPASERYKKQWPFFMFYFFMSPARWSVQILSKF